MFRSVRSVLSRATRPPFHDPDPTGLIPEGYRDTFAVRLRLLLVLFLIQGMVPAIGETAEAVVHYVATGHLAHTDADQGDLGDQGQEHGCSPTEHRCGCCTAQPVVAAQRESSVPRPFVAASTARSDAGRSLNRAQEPPFRPPIA